jgi:hypothetical protein
LICGRLCFLDVIPELINKAAEVADIGDPLELPLPPFSFGDTLVVVCIMKA